MGDWLPLISAVFGGGLFAFLGVWVYAHYKHKTAVDVAKIVTDPGRLNPSAVPPAMKALAEYERAARKPSQGMAARLSRRREDRESGDALRAGDPPRSP